MKIQSVTPTEKGGYTGQYGYMFTYNVTLDDGTSGEVSCKNENQWKVGDEVELTSKQENQFGTRLRLQKPQQAGGFKSFANDPAKQARIDASWAITNAIAMGKTSTSDEIVAYANWLLKCRDAVVDGLNKPEPAPAPANPGTNLIF